MRLILLDSGPLGLLSNPRGGPDARACQGWASLMLDSGTRLYVPEVCDYEVRRELIRAGALKGLARLDRLRESLDFAPINSAVMLRAAELWAQARAMGRPTAPPEALDADCILAAQALLAPGPDDEVMVATANVGHLGLFVAAEPWERIGP